MTGAPLTPRQAEVLEAIRAYIAQHGYSPTDRELAQVLGVKPATARGFVELLERKGQVVLRRGDSGRVLSRTMVVVVV